MGRRPNRQPTKIIGRSRHRNGSQHTAITLYYFELEKCVPKCVPKILWYPPFPANESGHLPPGPCRTIFASWTVPPHPATRWMPSCSVSRPGPGCPLPGRVFISTTTSLRTPNSPNFQPLLGVNYLFTPGPSLALFGTLQKPSSRGCFSCHFTRLGTANRAASATR